MVLLAQRAVQTRRRGCPRGAAGDLRDGWEILAIA
jgi:hypothetical protein